MRASDAAKWSKERYRCPLYYSCDSLENLFQKINKYTSAQGSCKDLKKNL